jgi:glycosyltransferase involved in cell wall biosynthesis
MKILHAAETIKGGVATVMRQLMLAHASEQDVGAILCLIPASHRSELFGVGPEAIRCFERSGRNLISLWRFLVAFVKVVMHERPDVVHLHSSFAGVVGRICLIPLAIVVRPKVVYCPHAFPFLIKTSPILVVTYKLAERMLEAVTDVIICVSQHERQLAMRAGLKKKKLVLIHNGIHAPDLPNERQSIENAPLLRLLFVGRFDRQKGFDILLAAMRLLEGKPIELLAVGEPVNEEERPEAQKNVTYLGWLDAAALHPVFASAHILVVPSRWEGFAMVPLEGMSHGLSIIASDCSSLPEVVVNDVTGRLFPVEDSFALAKCIVSKSKSEWMEMGTKGMAKFQNEFTAKRMTESTLNIYRGLLRMKPAIYDLPPSSIGVDGSA